MFTLDKFLSRLGVFCIYFCLAIFFLVIKNNFFLVMCFWIDKLFRYILFHSNKVKEKARVTCTPVDKVKDDTDHLDCAKNT